MQTKLKVDSQLPVNQNGMIRTAKIRKIGPVYYDPKTSAYGWAMLTLDVGGEVAYAPARADEIDFEDSSA